MANCIFYNPEGYIEVSVEGDQSYMSFVNLMPEAATMLEQLQKEGKPRLGLIDVTHQGAHTAESNHSALEMLETLDYERLAIFGANTMLSEVIKGIVIAMGKGEKIKIFKTREDAVEWVLGGSGTSA
jgi:hypothetical protein